MVMPRSRSMSMLSRSCSCMSLLATVPVSWRRRSASVDLPWSMWAMMLKLRIRLDSTFLYSLLATAVFRRSSRDMSLVLLSGSTCIRSPSAALRPHADLPHSGRARVTKPEQRSSGCWKALAEGSAVEMHTSPSAAAPHALLLHTYGAYNISVSCHFMAVFCGMMTGTWCVCVCFYVVRAPTRQSCHYHALGLQKNTMQPTSMYPNTKHPIPRSFLFNTCFASAYFFLLLTLLQWRPSG